MLLPLLSSEEVSGHHGQRSVVITASGTSHASALPLPRLRFPLMVIRRWLQLLGTSRPRSPIPRVRGEGHRARAFSPASLFYQGEKAFPGIPGQAHAP